MKNNNSIRLMSHIAYLSAISFILMLLQLPLPIFPTFLKLDVSDIPALISVIIFGPISGIVVQFFKNFLYFVIKGSSSGGVGEIANFIIGIALVLPTGLFYKKTLSLKSYILGGTIGIFSMVIIASLINYFVLLPLYSIVLGVPIDAFVDMGNALNSNVVDLKTFILLSILPFNLLKGSVTIFTSYLLIKALRPIILKTIHTYKNN